LASVLQLTKLLSHRPEVIVPAGYGLRTFQGPADVPLWLALRDRAFARLRVGIRSWSSADFDSELTAKPWWRDEHLWFVHGATDPADVVGSVVLAARGEGPTARPVVHWLSVLPSHRRNGLGRLLMARLEQQCWDLGQRQVWLETHVAWTAAVELYRHLGYLPATGVE
jgi:GNAT superfamily N-acetyltransferase